MSVEAIRLMNARLSVTSAKADKELGVTFRPVTVTLEDTVSYARASLQEKTTLGALVLSASQQKTA
jgi:CBS domain-containing protein